MNNKRISVLEMTARDMKNDARVMVMIINGMIIQMMEIGNFS